MSARPRITIIDDDEDILAGTAMLLSDKYQVVTYNDGLQALAALRTRPSDLILLDLLMPKIGGAEFLAELDHAHIDTPTVVMTASSNCHVVLRNSHFNGLIRKPFSIEELESLIERVLSRNKLASPAHAS